MPTLGGIIFPFHYTWSNYIKLYIYIHTQSSTYLFTSFWRESLIFIRIINMKMVIIVLF
ncbi:hypothetical protein Hanom_Chr16g01506081 [Helianthus anomalus]